MDIKTAIGHCQALVSFHLSAEEHECADEDNGQAISKVLDALAEATTLPEGDLGEAVRGCKEALVQLEEEPSLRFTAMFQPGHVAAILRAFAAYKRMSDIADEDRTRLTIVLVEVQDEVTRLTEDRDCWKASEETAEESNVRLRSQLEDAKAKIVWLEKMPEGDLGRAIECLTDIDIENNPASVRQAEAIELVLAALAQVQRERSTPMLDDLAGAIGKAKHALACHTEGDTYSLSHLEAGVLRTIVAALATLQGDVVELQTRDEEAAKYDEEAMKRECEARAKAEFKRDEFQAEIVRLQEERDEYAAMLDLLVDEIGNATADSDDREERRKAADWARVSIDKERALESDLKESREAEAESDRQADAMQAKWVEVVAIAKQATDDIMAVQGTLEASEREVARLAKEINSYKDLAVRLGVVTEERDAARAGIPTDEFLQKKVDELRAECDDMTSQFIETAVKLYEAQEELEASRKARVDLSIGFDNAIKCAEKAEHERDIWMATRLGDANKTIKLINTKVAIVTAELRKRTEETEAATKALKDYIVYAFHEAARDPARKAYSALIELEKRVATGKFGSAPCPSCKALRERDMVALITTYRDWNFATFGDEKPRTERIVEHIRSELEEVLADPSDLMEWVDVMLFAWQGALRAGHSPEAIVEGVKQKMAKNKGRRWSNDILPEDGR